MKYDVFVEKVSSFGIFGDDLLSTFDWAVGARHLQMNRWVRAGKLVRLKRGLYTLPEGRRRVAISNHWLANILYTPSYLSLESILSRYDMIPERVEAVTSVTRLKTATFQNPLGRFVYRHLKSDLFFGFEEVEDEFHRRILQATPEKALLDFIYLHRGWVSSPEFVEHNIRFQQLEQLKKKKLKDYAMRYNSKKIRTAVDVILGVIKS